MNIDAAKWFADYDKIIDFASLGLTGKEFVLAYDINNPAMYEKLVRHSETLLVLDDKDFFARWQKKLEIDALLKKDDDVPTLMVCDTIAKAIEELGKGSSGRVVGLVVDGSPEEFCKAFVKEWERRDMKKSDLIIMNPPYAGKGKPLFMEISKVIYENCLSDLGRLVSINPTSIVDNTYDGLDSHSQTLRDDYMGMKVKNFDFDSKYRTAFDASIGTGICVITYAKDGKYNLWSDYVREKRFGQKNWNMRKRIIGKVGVSLKYIDEKPTNGIACLSNFYGVIDSNIETRKQAISAKQSEIGLTKWIVTMAFNRGNMSAVGEHKWDWTTLQSEDSLKLTSKIPPIQHFGVPCSTKIEAINLLKWLNTDMIMFIINHYKTQISNSTVFYRLLPQPPTLDGNYSDEVLMKHFNLTQEEMDWIHSEMKDFGWKVNLKKTESELMAHIDEINK